MLSTGEIKSQGVANTLSFSNSKERKKVVLLVATHSASTKNTWSLVAHCFCTVTGKKYYIGGNFSCNTTNLIYVVYIVH